MRDAHSDQHWREWKNASCRMDDRFRTPSFTWERVTMALDPDFRGGITVAAADLTGDNKAEVAVGAGPTGGSHINVYNPLTGSPISGPLSSFFAFGTANRDGVFLGADALAGDVNADGTPDPGTVSIPIYNGNISFYSWG